jgi:hypothetical protein
VYEDQGRSVLGSVLSHVHVVAVDADEVPDPSSLGVPRVGHGGYDDATWDPMIAQRGYATIEARRSQRLPEMSRKTTTRPYGSVRGSVRNSTPAARMRW